MTVRVDRGAWSVGAARVLASALVAAFTTIALISCAARESGLASMPPRPRAVRTISKSEFRAPSGGSEPAPAPAVAAATAADAPLSPAPTQPGTDPPAPAEAARIPVSVTHAGLVGQVNGRPIYVADFFEPIENELRIRGREKTRREFVQIAFPLIQRQLAELIKNELVYAEAEASLTENERIGLRYFIRQLESDVTRTRGRLAQEERLREETGLGVDEVVELERRRQLVLYKIQSEIRRRVIVSWRDVERYYRDHREEFNPPASIQLRLLTVPANDAARRRAVEQALADGFLFGPLAEEHSTMLASRGGLLDPTPLSGGIENTALTRWPEVDALARTLRQGEHGGPVVAGDLAVWVYVEQYADGTGRSLYDAQHEIENRLFQERYAEEERRYLSELFARGNMDDFDNMSYLLLDIALQRWAAPE